jgi:hypothetical protein
VRFEIFAAVMVMMMMMVMVVVKMMMMIWVLTPRGLKILFSQCQKL